MLEWRAFSSKYRGLRMFLDPQMFPPKRLAANRRIWLVLALYWGTTVSVTHFAGFDVRILYRPLFIYLFSVCAALSLIYRFLWQERSIFMLGECVAQLLLASGAVMIAAGLLIHMDLPLADDWLSNADRLLGFSWEEHANWMHASPDWLREILAFCYRSYGAQLALLIPVLCYGHHAAQAQRMVMAFLLGGFTMALLGGALPAIGHDSRLAQDFLEARRATEPVITYPSLAMSSFPALHSILAVMLIYASAPLKWLRWGVIPLNIGMLIATPYYGGHYLVDVIVGIVVAFLAVYVAEQVIPPDPAAPKPASLARTTQAPARQ